MVDGIVAVVGALTHSALLHSVCDLKAAQMNVQRGQIQEFILYEFKLDHNSAEANKTFIVQKVKTQFDHGILVSLFKKSLSVCKNFDNQARSNRTKTMDSTAVYQAREKSGE